MATPIDILIKVLKTGNGIEALTRELQEARLEAVRFREDTEGVENSFSQLGQEAREAGRHIEEALRAKNANRLEQEIIDINRELQDAERQAQMTERQIEDLFMGDFNMNEAGIEQFNQELAQTEIRAQSLEEKLEQLFRQYEQVSSSTTEGAASMQRASGETDQLAQQVHRLTVALNQLSGASRTFDELAADSAQAAHGLDRLAREARGYEAATERAALITQRLRQNMRETGATVADLEREIDQLEQQMRRLDKSSGQADTALSRIGQGAAFGTGFFIIEEIIEETLFAIARFAAEAPVAFAEYDSKIRLIFSQTKDASAELRAGLADDLLQLNTEIGRLSEETTEAARKALNLGVSEDNLFDVLAQSSDFAREKAGNFSDTLEIGLNTVNAYQIGTEKLGEVFSALGYIIDNSGLELQDLEGNMNGIISTAGEAGFAIQDVAAAMVVMSNQGDDIEEISSLLSNFFTQAQIDGTELGGLIKDLTGTNLQEFLNSGGSLVEVLKLIQQESERTGKSVLELATGTSKFYRDAQAGRATAELVKFLGDIETESQGARQAIEQTGTSISEFADSAQLALDKAAASAERMKIRFGEASEERTKLFAEAKSFLSDQITAEIENIDRLNQKLQATPDFIAQIPEGMDRGIVRQVIDDLQLYAEAGETSASATAKLAIAQQKLAEDSTLSGKALREVVNAQYEYNQTLERALAAEGTRTGGSGRVIALNKEKEAFEETAEAAKEYADIVARVLDGDTFATTDGREIRLARIDTPEVDTIFGDEATRLTQEFVLDAEIHVEEIGTDQYDRVLGEVTNSAEENLSNILVRAGLAIEIEQADLSPAASAQIRTLALKAAEEAKGIFESFAIRDRFFSNLIQGDDLDSLLKLEQEFRNTFEKSLSTVQNVRDLELEVARARGEGTTAIREAEEQLNQYNGVAEANAAALDRLAEIQGNAADSIFAAQAALDRAGENDTDRAAAVGKLADEYQEAADKIRETAGTLEGESAKAAEALASAYEETGNAIREAEGEVAEAKSAIIESLRQIAFEAYLAENGLTEASIAFGVALGIFNETDAQGALDLTRQIAQTETLIERAQEWGLTQGELIEATKLIESGMATTALEAATIVGNVSLVRGEIQLTEGDVQALNEAFGSIPGTIQSAGATLDEIKEKAKDIFGGHVSDEEIAAVNEAFGGFRPVVPFEVDTTAIDEAFGAFEGSPLEVPVELSTADIAAINESFGLEPIDLEINIPPEYEMIFGAGNQVKVIEINTEFDQDTIDEINEAFGGALEEGVGTFDEVEASARRASEAAQGAASDQQLVAEAFAESTENAAILTEAIEDIPEEKVTDFDDSSVEEGIKTANELKAELDGIEGTYTATVNIKVNKEEISIPGQGGGGGATQGPFARGGPFTGTGGPFLVGEEGPEIIIPNKLGDGVVINARETAEIMQRQARGTPVTGGSKQLISADQYYFVNKSAKAAHITKSIVASKERQRIDRFINGE